MKQYFVIFIFFIQLPIQNSFAQNRHTIHGTITDTNSSEQLISAIVFDQKSNEGTSSNNFGFYSISLPRGEVKLKCQYVGYEPKIISLFLTKDTLINIQLVSGLNLKEVQIISSKEEQIDRSTRMSTIDVPIEQIKKVPALFGEVDVLKVLQLLPGVSGGTEGTSGLYVRGGSPDQNLILLDGVPVYNVSHVGGIFSTFNSDALKNVSLTKGGFPARYGGRLSSVLEINMKEGNMNEFHGEGGIGIIASRLTLEGPIKKDKASFMISGRRTYLDLIGRLFLNASAEEENEVDDFDLFFHDLNAKVNWKLNDKHRFYLSGYFGKDKFGVSYTDTYADTLYNKGLSNINWGNITSAFRWNYGIRPNLFANTTLTYSKYQFNIIGEFEDKSFDGVSSFAAKYYSGIEDVAAKIDFDYLPIPSHTIKFGTQAINHIYRPGAFNLKFENGGSNPEKLDTLLGPPKTQSVETATYVEDDMKFGALGINAGLHFSTFIVPSKTYYSLQPRLAARYFLSKEYTAKASFATMTQFINLLTNEGAGLPTDLWVPSTKKIIPQESWQLAAGVVRVFKDEYEVSIEAFYKRMNQVISYKEGSSFINISETWEDKITQGNGKAYGTEFFVQKKKGKFNGWVGYTLSWNYRQFDDVNSGRQYRFKYDRRHDFEVVANYQLSKRWSVSGSWQFATGNSITLPVIKYLSLVEYYKDQYYTTENHINGNKNAYTMPPYHRMDLSFEYRKIKTRYESAWVFGLYNAYSRANPFFIVAAKKYDTKTNEEKTIFQQISILPIIPNISYQFKF
ncbi:MAG: TonB-dependent receptor plug domain-containing protein [Saprospiraceae bacterium]|nr:TonB-dependent receptor plug domain-containing protein [Saprospiraceae bacterium]